MRPGPLPYPKIQLHPSLRAAARQAILDGRPSASTLALMLRYHHVGRLLYHPMPASLATRTHAQQLADILGYAGPLFETPPRPRDVQGRYLVQVSP